MNRLERIENRVKSVSLQYPLMFDPSELHRVYLRDVPALLAVVRVVAEWKLFCDELDWQDRHPEEDEDEHHEELMERVLDSVKPLLREEGVPE